MFYQKTISLVLLTAFAVFSQQINISGKVTDTSGVTPIAGAVVKLEKHGYTATTGTDGIFTLTGAVSISSNSHQLQPNAFSANMYNGMLSLYLPERGAVTITTYTMQGKAVSKVQKMLDVGAHRIEQPRLGHGVYIYKIRAGSRELVLKSSSFGGSGGAFALSSQTKVTASSANRYAPINDIIFASKEGLLNYRVTVKNSDTSGIVIKMIPNAGNVTDADGNVYQSVRIGNQVWTVENWRCTKYNDGTAIPHVPDSAAWDALTTPGYCYYNNTTNADAIKKWGALYNGLVVSPSNPKQIAPAGWRVPDTTDWNILKNYLIANGYNWDGTVSENKIAKSMAARTDWLNHDTTGTIGCNVTINNASGFSALPGGFRGNTGEFCFQGWWGFWYSASMYPMGGVYDYYLLSGYSYLGRNAIGGCAESGCSVRLLRDIVLPE